jgi:hypothetical protein
MLGRAIEVLFLSQLNDAAQIHHGYTVADMFYYGKIVSDKKVCEMKLLLQILQEIQDLGLDGDVQGRDGFISNN